MDSATLGHRLRALRTAAGRTVASVATDAGLSVPYVANLENGRGNPTLTALNRLAGALGTELTIAFGDEPDAGRESAPLPASLVRLRRTRRFRRDTQRLADTLDRDPQETAARLVSALAELTQPIGREPSEADWLRLLDALLLVMAHPNAED